MKSKYRFYDIKIKKDRNKISKGKIFFDIEANQDITSNPLTNDLLQIGAIRIKNNGEISKFNDI